MRRALLMIAILGWAVIVKVVTNHFGSLAGKIVIVVPIVGVVAVILWMIQQISNEAVKQAKETACEISANGVWEVLRVNVVPGYPRNAYEVILQNEHGRRIVFLSPISCLLSNGDKLRFQVTQGIYTSSTRALDHLQYELVVT